MPLADIFKSKKELEDEQKRQQRREMRDATRSCDRIQSDLDRQAKELESQIKAAAAKNDTLLAKTLAKQLIKVRNEKTRAIGAKSKISSIASHASSMQTTNKLAQVMSTSAAAISKVNQQMNPEQLAQTLGQFQAETTKMDMKESAMEDMFEELFEDDAGEADEIMDQVLAEIGLETGARLSQLPATSKAGVATGQSTTAKAKDNPSGVKH